LLSVVLAAAAGAASQAPADPAQPTETPVVRKTGDSTFEIGRLRVDTAGREATVPASLNEVQVLEFIANARGGSKAYESALTLDVDAITFNTALLLIGLDPARGRPPETVFDPTPVEGDPVDLSVAWGTRRVPIDDLLYDQRTKRTVPRGAWVYTGSTFIDAGAGKQYAAELDGVLIGFMHSPSSIIERVEAILGYGEIIVNPRLGLRPNTPATLTIRALPRRR
jgi:hypothetical protein